VIRSLFYTYKPFVTRLRRPQAQVCDPHRLKGLICVKLWHERKAKEHHFFLKFANRSTTNARIPRYCSLKVPFSFASRVKLS
jgi:hypothetical protein